jgi:hypothetical protein
MLTAEAMREGLTTLPSLNSVGDESFASWREHMDRNCEILEAAGTTLKDILDNILQFLEIGRSVEDSRAHAPEGARAPGAEIMSDLLTGVLENKMKQLKRLQEAEGAELGQFEVMFEVLPRVNGGWIVLQDAEPLRRWVRDLLPRPSSRDCGLNHLFLPQDRRSPLVQRSARDHAGLRGCNCRGYNAGQHRTSGLREPDDDYHRHDHH